MTVAEIEPYAEKIRKYQENGWIRNFLEEEPQKLEVIDLLIKLGMEPEAVTEYLAAFLEYSPAGRERQVRLLRKYRCSLLEQIHEKQQILDQLDYYISSLKKEETVDET